MTPDSYDALERSRAYRAVQWTRELLSAAQTIALGGFLVALYQLSRHAAPRPAWVAVGTTLVWALALVGVRRCQRWTRERFAALRPVRALATRAALDVGDALRAYLDLEAKMLAAEARGDEAGAERRRGVMDVVWPHLTSAERDALHARDLRNQLPAQTPATPRG